MAPKRAEYYERIEMQPIDPQANGPQLFYGLRYHLHVNTREEDIAFHDQVGYWLYEAATGLDYADPGDPARADRNCVRAMPSRREKAGRKGRARTNRIWYLLDHLPRSRLSYRHLSD